MTLTFGFALGSRKKIVYMRVQDHLRKMGLGQRALKRMMEPDLGYTELQPEVSAETPDAQTFRRLFQLARPPARASEAIRHRASTTRPRAAIGSGRAAASPPTLAPSTPNLTN